MYAYTSCHRVVTMEVERPRVKPTSPTPYYTITITLYFFVANSKTAYLW